MIESPWRVMSGSATPRASTRLRMISMAWSRTPEGTLLRGWSTTEAPPWRSRPSWGELPEARVSPRAPAASTRTPIRQTAIERGTDQAFSPVGGRASWGGGMYGGVGRRWGVGGGGRRRRRRRRASGPAARARATSSSNSAIVDVVVSSSSSVVVVVVEHRRRRRPRSGSGRRSAAPGSTCPGATSRVTMSSTTETMVPTMPPVVMTSSPARQGGHQLPGARGRGAAGGG